MFSKKYSKHKKYRQPEQIAREDRDGKRLSTVRLSMPALMGEEYESLYYGAEDDWNNQFVKRYFTREDAVAGHNKLVTRFFSSFYLALMYQEGERRITTTWVGHEKWESKFQSNIRDMPYEQKYAYVTKQAAIDGHLFLKGIYFGE